MATQTLWRKSAWVGLFGDKTLSESTLQGGFPTQAMRSFSLHLRAAVADPSADLTPTQTAAVGQVCALLEKAARITVRYEHIQRYLKESSSTLSTTSDDGSADTAAEEAAQPSIPDAEPAYLPDLFSRHWEDLRALPPGGCTLWDYGWQGHAIGLVIERGGGSGDTASLTVCNSGSGIQRHPSTVSFYPKYKYRTALHLPDLPWHKLCSDSTAYLLLAPMVRELHSGSEPGATADGGKDFSLYEVALPHLVPEGAVEAAVQAAEARGLHGEWETPQVSGMCYLRGTMTMVRYLLHRRFAFPAALVKRLFAAVRVAYIEHAAADLDGTLTTLEAGPSAGGAAASLSALGAAAAQRLRAAQLAYAEDPLGQDNAFFGSVRDAFTTSDSAMVALGARQTARALAKLLQRAHCASASAWPLARGLPAVEALYATLGRLEVRLFGSALTAVPGLVQPQPPAPASYAILPLAPSDALMPGSSALAWEGFSLLARIAEDTSMFEGALVDDPSLHGKPADVLPLLQDAPLQHSGSAASAPPCSTDIRSFAPLLQVKSLEDVAAVLSHCLARVEALVDVISLTPSAAPLLHNRWKVMTVKIGRAHV